MKATVALSLCMGKISRQSHLAGPAMSSQSVDRQPRPLPVPCSTPDILAHVHAPPKQKVDDAYIDHFDVDGQYPSDHFPVVGIVTFAAKN